MEVICIEDEAFYLLIERVVARIMEKNVTKEEKWVTLDVAMAKLKVKSKSTMQKLRDEGRIRYSQPEKKIILYDVDSLNEFLEKHANETF